MILISLVSMALAQVSIEITVFPKAIVGALFAAKAVLVLDETPLAHALDRHRRITAVAVKTILYGMATLALGYLERLREALNRVHSFDEALRYVIDHASRYRLSAWAMGISILFGLYFAFFEISERMGPGGPMEAVL